MNRSTIILITVLLVLGGITYFLIPSDKEREASYKPGQISFSIDSASVVKIELHRPSKSITIENVGGKWTITSPLRYPADPAFVLQLIGGVAHFKQGSLISSNPEKQSIFQVDSSGTRLTLTERSGKSVTMIVGKMGPSYSEVYFRLPDSKDVYLGEGIEDWAITRDVKDWRDKTILTIPSESIKGLTYGAGSKEYSLQRDTSGWKMNGETVELNGVTPAINSIANLRADDFADTLSAFPPHPVTIAVKGSETVTLNVAPVLPDSANYYVQSSTSHQTFLVSKWTARQIMKPVEKQVMPVKNVPPAVTAKRNEKKPAMTSQEKEKPSVPPRVSAQKKASVPPVSAVKGTKKIPKQKGKTPPAEQPPVTSNEQKEAPPVTTGQEKPAENPPPATTASPSASTSASDDDGDLTVHTVKKGETMQTVAKKYNVTVEQILKWNLLKSINVKPGQELYVYIKKK